MQFAAPFLCPQQGLEQVRIGEYVVLLDHRNVATQLMAYGLYERSELVQLSRLIKPGSTVFDLGANVGYCSAKFAEMVGPNGSVFSFEPSPTCLEHLSRMQKSSSSNVISVVPQGVAEASRTTTYFETERILSHGFGRLDIRPSSRHQVTSEKEVLVTSIDDFFEKNQLGKIDFIKIDVEGAETKVLDGMNRTFGSGERPLMMIEMSGGERFREEAKAIHNRLARLGYTSHLFDRGLPEVDVLRLGNRFHGNVLWNYQHSNLSAQRRDS